MNKINNNINNTNVEFIGNYLWIYPFIIFVCKNL